MNKCKQKIIIHLRNWQKWYIYIVYSRDIVNKGYRLRVDELSIKPAKGKKKNCWQSSTSLPLAKCRKISLILLPAPLLTEVSSDRSWLDDDNNLEGGISWEPQYKTTLSASFSLLVAGDKRLHEQRARNESKLREKFYILLDWRTYFTCCDLYLFLPHSMTIETERRE